MSLFLFLDAASTAVVPGSLGMLVQLISVLVWPLVISIFLLTQRRVIGRLFSALASLAESADKIKVWQVEVERGIDKQMDQAAKASQNRLDVNPDISKHDVIAATRVESLVERLPSEPSKDRVLGTVKLRMLALADDYDSIRASMPSGRERTVAMNRIAAQMRALGIVAKSELREFSRDEQSAGVRLCAIAILQMAPNSRYIDWLVQRFAKDQPFVFYQAAIALMEATRKLDGQYQMPLQTAIERAIQQLKSFTGGVPDQNSMNVLSAALRQLRPATKSDPAN